MSSLKIVQVFGDLLGTYGDNGNALVLWHRAKWRGVDAEVIAVSAADDVPDDGDIYVIGGGEDGPQSRAAELLADSGSLHRAVERKAAVLAVCAGFQMLGHSFLGPDGRSVTGLGLLDVTSKRTRGDRIVGDVVVDTKATLDIGRLSGYENHAGVTALGPDATPLGRVTFRAAGSREDVETYEEGALQGRIVGTYLHGPVLARNPALADRLIAWGMRCDVDQLTPLDDRLIDALREDRFAHAHSSRSRLWFIPWRAARARR